MSRTSQEYIAHLDNERAKEKLERENSEKRFNAETTQEKRDKEKAEKKLKAEKVMEEREGEN